MHRTGSSFPDIRPFLLPSSCSDSSSKLPDSETDNLLIYCSDFHCISNVQHWTYSIYSVFEFGDFGQCVCGDLLLSECKVLLLLLLLLLRAFVQDDAGEQVPKGWTILDFTEAEMTGWQWHQLDNMQPKLQTAIPVYLLYKALTGSKLHVLIATSYSMALPIIYMLHNHWHLSSKQKSNNRFNKRSK